MTWHLDPRALEALRAELLERGKVLELRAAARLGKPPLAATSEAETLLRRVAPFLELLYLMMQADGKCDERERQLLRGVARTLCGAELSGATVERQLLGFDANQAAVGAASRLEEVAGQLCSDRLDAEAAFTLTTTMALADEAVAVPERVVLEQLADVLGISASRARELVAQRPLTAPTRPAP